MEYKCKVRNALGKAARSHPAWGDMTLHLLFKDAEIAERRKTRMIHIPAQAHSPTKYQK